MIGDKIILKSEHLSLAKKLLDTVDSLKSSDRFAIAIGGESGSGKSTLALAIKEILDHGKIPSFVFHMDDYFRLPPKANHKARQEDLSRVGITEIDMDLLSRHIDDFIRGRSTIDKPLVDYENNIIGQEEVVSSHFRVAIIEGTYVLTLPQPELKVFMLRDFRDTFEARRNRGRDPVDEFNDKVLQIEHNIIVRHAQMANITVDKNYKIVGD